jgi:hypothetical protein
MQQQALRLKLIQYSMLVLTMAILQNVNAVMVLDLTTPTNQLNHISFF